MEIITRKATDQDKEACLWAEAGAIPGIRYIDAVWELFTRTTTGDLTAVFADGKFGGMGKFTHLYGGYGWLEALRIHPDFQGLGLGKAIYRRYLEEMEELGLSAIGMYTGVENAVSKGLAERFGLSLKGRFHEFFRPVSAAASGDDLGFVPVAPQEAEAILSGQYPKQGEAFWVVNRTFYPMKPGIGEHFAKEGCFYRDKAGNLLVAGTRFQPEKGLHVAFLYGDMEKTLRFADRLAQASGAARLSVVTSSQFTALHEILEQHGFAKSNAELITLWLGL